LDTVALQVIWWTGSRILEKRDCTPFYSSDNKDHVLGTGFLVPKRITHQIIDFKPITPRICILRMKVLFLITVQLMAMHLTETIDDEKDGVFDALETA
jgi:hypothetical protein